MDKSDTNGEQDDGLWPVVAAFALFGGVTFFLWVGGCSPVAAADLPAYQVSPDAPPAYQVSAKTPAAGVGGGEGTGSTPPPVQPQVGWWRWDGRGNVWFEPLTAPGVAVQQLPFTQPVGAPTVTDTTARSADGTPRTWTSSTPAPTANTASRGEGWRSLPGGGFENCGPLG